MRKEGEGEGASERERERERERESFIRKRERISSKINSKWGKRVGYGGRGVRRRSECVCVCVGAEQREGGGMTFESGGDKETHRGRRGPRGTVLKENAGHSSRLSPEVQHSSIQYIDPFQHLRQRKSALNARW